MTIQELFQEGMKRHIPAIIERGDLAINLGCGNTPMPGTVGLDLPDWVAPFDPIPYEDGSVDSIIAYHFLEHFHGSDVLAILRDCARVLKEGGTLTVCVPHRLSQMAYQDLDHRSFWCEETWRNLFNNPYYDKGRETPWPFAVRANFLMGLNERNLALFTQLEKVDARACL